MFTFHTKLPKKTFVGVFIVILLLSSYAVGYSHRTDVALIVWRHTHLDELALKINGKHPALPVYMGQYYFGGEHSDLKKAENAFTLALAHNPSVTWAHYQLGRIHFINGEFSRALEELTTELERYPEHKRVHYVRGLVYGYRYDILKDLGDLEKSEQEFKSFIEWAPEEWAGYNDLAWIQIKLEKFADAAQTVETAFEKIPWTHELSPWLWTSLGVANLNLKNYNESRDAFLRAKSISENITPEFFWSAYPGNDAQNAEEAYTQFDSTLHFNLGIVYEKLGENENAIHQYEAYLDDIPEGPFPGRTEVEQKISALSSHER